MRHGSGCAINPYNPRNLDDNMLSLRTRSSSKLSLQNGKEERLNSDNLSAHNVISGGLKCNWDAGETLSHKQIAANLGSHASDKLEVSESWHLMPGKF